MDVAEKQSLIQTSLARTAEALGDITGPVYALYYERCPEAQERFDHFYPEGRERLEGSMVEQALYCLMYWFDSPGEIEVVLISTVPHHIETLGVPGDMFARLITAVCDTVTATIPPEEKDELLVWEELHADLIGLCNESAKHARSVPAHHSA
ncbi:MAG: hypothetical protein WCY29_15225 [Novosphingobium sp.]